MWFLNKRRGNIRDSISREDIVNLVNNPAWIVLTQQWETDAEQLQELLMQAPLIEVRNAKGQLVMASFDNIRGQLDNLLAILTSASVLDEAIEADVSLNKSMKQQNKSGGQDNE